MITIMKPMYGIVLIMVMTMIWCQSVNAAMKSICDAHDTDPMPTWCKHQNPYITVFNVSDVKYSNDNCFTSQCSKSEDRGVRYTCTGTDPLSDCTSVKSITVLQFTPRLVPTNGSYQTGFDGWKPWPKHNPPILFVVMGLESGQVVANVVDATSSGPWRQQQNILVHREPDNTSPIKEVVSLSSSPNAAYVEHYGFFVTVDNKRTSFWVVNATIWPPVTNQGAPCNTFIHGDDQEVLRTAIWYSSYDARKVVLAQLRRSITKQTRVLHFWTFDGAALGDPDVDTYKVCAQMVHRTWTFAGGASNDINDFHHLAHQTNMSRSSVMTLNRAANDTSPTRDLIVVASAQYVHIYTYETEYQHGSTWTIASFGQPLATSLFYTPKEDSIITTTAIMGEQHQRYNQPGNHGLPCQLPWLLIGTQTHEAPGAVLSYIALNEFLFTAEVFSSPDGSIQLNAINDAAGRGRAVGWFWCKLDTQYYDMDVKACRDRDTYQQLFDGFIFEIVPRWRGAPLGENGQPVQFSISDLSQTAAHQNCDHYLSDVECKQDGLCFQYAGCLRNYTRDHPLIPENANECLFDGVANDTSSVDFLKGFLYHVIFVHTRDVDGLTDKVDIIGAQQALCDTWNSHNQTLRALEVRPLNQISFIGTVEQIHPSMNSMHLFTAVRRKYFDLEGTARFSSICRTLLNDSGNPFLQAFVDNCERYGAREPPNINDFAWYTSSCPPTIHCPDFESVRILPGSVPNMVMDGVYVNRALELKGCEPGFFCIQGAKKQCPPGYVCPNYEATAPTKCLGDSYHNTTCYHEGLAYQAGLAAPRRCPDGHICLVPYLPGQPAHPGYSVRSSDRSLHACHRGDWCVLGRSTTDHLPNGTIIPADLRCPSSTFCSTADALTPTICNFTKEVATYCPSGSWNMSLCAAGNYCSMPNKTDVCAQHQFCPAGSFAQSPCPGGYFCSTPQTQEICPSRFYCPVGTIIPRPCGLLTPCPEGSSAEGHIYLLPLILFALFVAPWIAWKCVIRRRDGNRKQRDAERKLRREIDAEEEHHDRSVKDASGQYGVDDGHSAASSNLGTLGMPLLFMESKDMISDGPQTHKQAMKKVLKRNTININGSVSGSGGSDGLSATEKITSPIDFTFNDLGLKLNGSGATVLAGVTGRILHGRVTAVMGPSGAGKTTFLSTLSGKASYGTQTGEILINGKPEPLAKYRTITGFVPQEDIMHRMLTVKEILYYAAHARLPRETTYEVKAKRVNDTLVALGLYDIRHSIIGDETTRGISGGQRKRVNIGMEIVGQPTVLFLDEPTSGLDSSSSKEVCECLRRVAESGLTIVTVIHQPRYEIFEMFHDVLLLGKGGRTVYLGPSKRALVYFTGLGFELPANANPADFFMDVISGEIPRVDHPEFKKEDLFDLWVQHQSQFADDSKRSSDATTSVASGGRWSVSRRDEENTTSGPAVVESPSTPYHDRHMLGFFGQLFLFTKRALVQQSRDWSTFLFDMALVLASGGFFGLIYYQRFYIGPSPASVVAQCPAALLEESPSPCRLPKEDPLPGQAAIATLTLGLTAVAASLRVFGNERTVFWRESSTGVSTLAYFLGKNLAHTFNLLMAPVCYLLIYYQLTTPFASFSSMYACAFLSYWTATGFGYLVSIVADPKQAQLFGVLSILVSMMFSGMNPRFVQLQSILGGILMYPTYFSFIRYAQEAYYLNEIVNYQSIFDDIQTGMDIYQFRLDNYWWDIGCLFAIGVVSRVLAYLCLEFMYRDRRK